MFTAAAIQLTSTSREDENLQIAAALIGRAANAGASLVVTPENTNFLGPHADKVGRAEPIGGRVTSFFADLARKHKLHVLIGSYNERVPSEAGGAPATRCYNTSVLLGPDGDVLGSYRKIHLFDVDVSADVRFKESDTCAPGSDPVVVSTALGTIGLSICYDLRFGELYRKLVDMGAEILTIPSAFTATTGKDHWEVLVRARAIECQSYVIAPGQSGQHDDNGLRHSHGHSMIVDPWGLVIGRASDGPNLALAEVDLSRVRKVRTSIPMAQHRRIRG